MMTEICRYEDCSGCGACFAVCPVRAVTMVEDGFRGLRPRVDQTLCIDCGQCREICPVCTGTEKRKPFKAFSAYSADSNDRETSASGGAASVLAHAVLAKGGVVYGCVQESAGNISHKRIDRKEDLHLLKGSKYVQSSTADAFLSVMSDLREGRNVLFIGTPCQVAGLKNLIGKNDKGLVTVDLCCHGVPPQSYLKAHLQSLKIDPLCSRVAFRRKDRGNVEFGLHVKEGDDRRGKWTVSYKDAFMSGFLSGIFFRVNCFTCPYACAERCGDITLADFWRIQEGDDPQMRSDRGLSAVFINSERGQMLFEEAEGAMIYEEQSIGKAMSVNAQFYRPSEKPEKYDEFVRLCERSGYEAACRKYMPSIKLRIFVKEMKSRYYSWHFRQYVRRILKRNR